MPKEYDKRMKHSLSLYRSFSRGWSTGHTKWITSCTYSKRLDCWQLQQQHCDGSFRCRVDSEAFTWTAWTSWWELSCINKGCRCCCRSCCFSCSCCDKPWSHGTKWKATHWHIQNKENLALTDCSRFVLEAVTFSLPSNMAYFFAIWPFVVKGLPIRL